MTVIQLINKLKKFDNDLEVVVEIDHDGFNHDVCEIIKEVDIFDSENHVIKLEVITK